MAPTTTTTPRPCAGVLSLSLSLEGSPRPGLARGGEEDDGPEGNEQAAAVAVAATATAPGLHTPPPALFLRFAAASQVLLCQCP